MKILMLNILLFCVETVYALRNFNDSLYNDSTKFETTVNYIPTKFSFGDTIIKLDLKSDVKCMIVYDVTFKHTNQNYFKADSISIIKVFIKGKHMKSINVLPKELKEKIINNLCNKDFYVSRKGYDNPYHVRLACWVLFDKNNYDFKEKLDDEIR